MKKIFITMFLLLIQNTVSAKDNDADVLQNRLNQISSFHANFIQEITDTDGIKIQKGEGKLWVRWPNLFKYHLTAPNENILISDGKTLWFYNPLVKQVSANWLKNTIDSIPLLLVIQNSDTNWKRYNVQQRGDIFHLTPKFDHSHFKQLTIQITSNGIIKKFISLEEEGQLIAFHFKNQTIRSVNKSKFDFTLPNGAILDDQRQ